MGVDEEEYLCAVVGLLFVCAVGCTMFVLLLVDIWGQGGVAQQQERKEDVENGDTLL